MLSLGEVITALEGCGLLHSIEKGDSSLLKGVVIDSREVQQGDLFVALKGQRGDGHDYVAEALERGAAAVLVERELPVSRGGAAILQVADTLKALEALASYWRAKQPAKVIGITGSVGKTTAKEVLAQVLSQRFRVLKSERSYNNEIGLPLTLLRLEPIHERVILEMGMYALGEIRALCQIARPQVGLVTNIGPSHMERLGSLEAITQAKGELLESLPEEGTAVLNGDDERVRAMRGRTRARVLLYGLDPAFHLWASDVESRSLEGVHFRMHCSGDSIPVETPLPGRPGLQAALAAATLAWAEGMSLEEIREGLAELKEPLRLRALPGLRGSTIIDDSFNASPASTLAALDLLAELGGRRIAVLGDMLELGPYEMEGHRQVGRRASEVTSHLIVIGERARIIGEEACRQGMAEVHFTTSKEEAADYLRALLQPGDTVLVKGSRAMGMEAIVEWMRQ